MVHEDRKIILVQIVQNMNFSYEEAQRWLENFPYEFGFITMAHYIRMLETKNFDRYEKDCLLRLAITKLNFSCYEGFFEPCKNIDQLYQKIFMIIMIQYVFEYFHCSNYFVWIVIGKYYIEEHDALCPEDSIFDGNPDSNKGKIYWFFRRKNIDLQEKFEYHQKRSNLFDFVIHYFKSR